MGEPTSVMRKRSADQKMRIHVYYDPDTIPALPARKRNKIKNEFIPASVEYFKNTLKVRRATTPIKLFRPCFLGRSYIQGDPIPYCLRGCKKIPKCGIITIPDEHLTGCYELEGGQGKKAGTDGAGVDTDFILYVSAKTTASCGPRTIAYASHCQLERALDRPVAGHVNICPTSPPMAGGDHKQAHAIATMKHEIIHALGFSNTLYGFFRDKDGNPMTAREDLSGLPPLDNNFQYTWSSNITKEFNRPGWKKVNMIVSPAVVREARRHFSCDTLEGGELEDQGGTGTTGSHWEKRIFENEAMTGALTVNPVLSRVTLAVLEDTGWYHVNYKMAEPLRYGFKEGCDFVKKSCKEYMQMKKAVGQSLLPYCDILGRENLDKQSCSADWTTVNYCNLWKGPKLLDAKYQPFTSIAGVNATDVPYYGGYSEMADYCPFWTKLGSTTATGATGDSQCKIASNQLADKRNFLRELFCTECLCFKLKGQFGLKRTVGSLLRSPKGGGGCYKIKCAATEAAGLKVYVDDTPYHCTSTGQEVSVSSQRNAYLHTGVIICPPYNEVCKNMTAPQYPGDDVLWGVTTGPGGGSGGGAGGESGGGSGNVTPATTLETSSAVSVLSVNWIVAIYSVMVQMVLFSHITSSISHLLC